MLTRSKKIIQEKLTNKNDKPSKTILEVNIDFDESIKEWRSNKKSIGNGQCKYLCQVIVIGVKNSVCERICYKGTNKCWNHRSK